MNEKNIKNNGSNLVVRDNNGDTGFLSDYVTSHQEGMCPHSTCIQTQHIIEPEVNELGVKKPGSVTRVISVNNDPPLTRQSDAEKCCIHGIMETYKRTGHLPITDAQPLEGEINTADESMDAMNPSEMHRPKLNLKKIHARLRLTRFHVLLQAALAPRH